MFRIISAAIVTLILGGCTASVPKGWECYEGKYKKPTGLLGIKVGVSRAAVERLLGKPIAERDVSNLTHLNYKTVAVYQYYLEPPERRYIMAPFSRVIGAHACPPAEDQLAGAPLAIAYDGDNRVIIKEIAIHRIKEIAIDRTDGDWLYDHELSRRDQKARAFHWRIQPWLTYLRFGLIPTPRQQDYWVCLNAYNWHAWALAEMGRRHWVEDKVQGFAWYSLASKADPAYAAQQNEWQKDLTSTQLSEAKKLASNLHLKIKNAPREWMDENPCDALPGG